MNNFSPHISFTELADIADKQSQPAAETLEHLATCSHCTKELQTLRQAIGLMRIDDVENAPASLIKNAKATDPTAMPPITPSEKRNFRPKRPLMAAPSSGSRGTSQMYLCISPLQEIDLVYPDRFLVAIERDHDS